MGRDEEAEARLGRGGGAGKAAKEPSVTEKGCEQRRLVNLCVQDQAAVGVSLGRERTPWVHRYTKAPLSVSSSVILRHMKEGELQTWPWASVCLVSAFLWAEDGGAGAPCAPCLASSRGRPQCRVQGGGGQRAALRRGEAWRREWQDALTQNTHLSTGGQTLTWVREEEGQGSQGDVSFEHFFLLSLLDINVPLITYKTTPPRHRLTWEAKLVGPAC